VALCALQLVIEPAYMAGEVAGIVDVSLQRLALHSSFGGSLALRAAGLACLALCPAKGGARALGVLGVGLTLGSFLLTGHTRSAGAPQLLGPLLGLHLLAVSFWLGALLPLRQLARTTAPEALAAVLRRFSAVAVWLVPLLGVAGLAMAVLLLPGVAALGSPYGLLLGAKALLFATLLGLAALNRQRLTPALARGGHAALPVLRRSLAAEYALIAITLGVTAALTGLYSPGGPH
jgi:putative copper export protein